MTFGYNDFDSFFLSIFPTSITAKDFRSRTIDETIDRFRTDFFYGDIAPYVDLAQPGRDVTIEILVDFPWNLFVKREIVSRQICEVMSKAPRFPGEVLRETFLMDAEEYKKLAAGSFQHFAQEAISYLQSTPLQHATTVVDGFGVPEVRSGNPDLTLRLASEYDVHTLTYHDEKRTAFNTDILVLTKIGEEQQKPPEYINPVCEALNSMDEQVDCHNFHKHRAGAIELLANLLGCSFSEIAITIDRVGKMKGGRVVYISAFNKANPAHMVRLSPESVYAQKVMPALETMMQRRYAKTVKLQTIIYN